MGEQKRDRLISNQAATIRALTVLAEAGRKAGLEPLTWQVSADLMKLFGTADMTVWQPGQMHVDEEATAAARRTAFEGWSTLIGTRAAYSIAEYGHHPSGGSMDTAFTVHEPSDPSGLGLAVEHRAVAHNVNIDVGRLHRVWLLFLGVRTVIDKPGPAAGDDKPTG